MCHALSPKHFMDRSIDDNMTAGGTCSTLHQRQSFTVLGDLSKYFLLLRTQYTQALLHPLCQ